jgi:hypothetical protein
MLEFAMDVASSTSQLPATPPHLPLIRPPSYEEQKGQNESSDILWSKSNRIAASDILLWLLKLPQDSPYRKSLGEYGRLVGTVSWQSSGSLVNSSGGSERFLKNSVIISIEIPIVRRAFTMRSQQHFGQWTHSFRVSRILPDDSPIFKICATKDTTAVRKLFESGMASPFDQTASGITLLHVRIIYTRFVQNINWLYRLPLLDIGARRTSCFVSQVWNMDFARILSMVNCEYKFQTLYNEHILESTS